MNISDEQLLAWKLKGFTLNQITEETGINRYDLRYYYMRYGIPYNFSKKFVSWDLSKIQDPCDIDGQYVIGMLAADGSLSSDKRSVVIWLQEKDVEILHRILSVLGKSDGNIMSRKPSSNSYNVSPLLGVSIGSTLLVQYLKTKYGFQHKKSRTLPFPGQLINPVPFLRGFFDGDGYVGDGVNFCVGSPSFVDGFLYWLRNFYGWDDPLFTCWGKTKTSTALISVKSMLNLYMICSVIRA